MKTSAAYILAKVSESTESEHHSRILLTSGARMSPNESNESNEKQSFHRSSEATRVLCFERDRCSRADEHPKTRFVLGSVKESPQPTGRTLMKE